MKKELDKTKPPPGYRLRMGTLLGHGRQEAKITNPEGFFFTWQVINHADGKTREQTITRLWELHEEVLKMSRKSEQKEI